MQRIIVTLTFIATLTALLVGASSAQQTTAFGISAASFLGGSGDADSVRGARILSDGTVVLAANIGAATPGDVSPTLLNGATADAGGAVLRLSADGQRVLAVTRVAAQVTDLTIDADDNIYVALWSDGLVKLDPTASTVLWVQTPGTVLRIDAGGAGDAATVAALVTTASDPDSSNPGSGTIAVYNAAGESLGSFAGHRNTLDVCLDTASKRVVSIGWRQANTSDGTSTKPVQIAYLRGASYNGTTQWTDYDWSADQNAPDWINRSENNMADSRGYRCTLGGDGKLYAAFEVAGGNHIFRYSPLDITEKVAIVGGDQWHNFSNTRSEHKTFFARYDPATGAYLKGQQFTGRLTSGKGNAMRVRVGAIAADAQGRVYIGGESAWGLPLPPHPNYTPKPGETTFNHLEANADAYLGGAWLLVMDADFKTRLYTTRLTTDGATRAIDARTLSGDAANIVFAGSTAKPDETYTTNAVQPNAVGDDGWFAVIDSAAPGDDPGTTPTPPRTDLTPRAYLPLLQR